MLHNDPANTTIENLVGYTPLMMAAMGDNVSLVTQLLDKNADSNAADCYGETAIVKATQGGKTANVEAFLDRKADIKASVTSNQTTGTLLNIAAAHGHETTVKMLLKRGADLETKDFQGRTPILNAVEQYSPVREGSTHNHNNVVRALADHKANIEVRDRGHLTPLMRAAIEDRGDLISTLLEYKANIDASTPNGTTALMFAAMRLQGNTVAQLVAAGAKTDAKTHKGETAADLMAKERDQQKQKRIAAGPIIFNSPPSETQKAAIVAAQRRGLKQADSEYQSIMTYLAKRS